MPGGTNSIGAKVLHTDNPEESTAPGEWMTYDPNKKETMKSGEFEKEYGIRIHSNKNKLSHLPTVSMGPKYHEARRP
jgi:hypothetical protein